MEISTTKFALLCVGLFAAVVAVNFILRYRSNEDFRQQLIEMSPAELFGLRSKLVEQENMGQAIQNENE